MKSKRVQNLIDFHYKLKKSHSCIRDYLRHRIREVGDIVDKDRAESASPTEYARRSTGPSWKLSTLVSRVS